MAGQWTLYDILSEADPVFKPFAGFLWPLNRTFS
jgi:hypothetical protein